MIGPRELRELAAFTARETPVLSLYLDTDLSRQLKDQVKLVLRDLLERAGADGAPADDLERVSHFVDLEYDWQGRGLVIFTCQADGLWQPLPLPVPVKSQAFVGEQAYLMPLAKLLDKFAPYGVAVVDQEGGRLFLVDMGGVVEQEEAMGEPIKHHKQGGWSATRWQRHEDRLAHYNLRVAAEATVRFCERHGCPRLILAGTDENTARFRDLLPHNLRQVVVGTVALDRTAGAHEAIERSREILDDVEAGRERDLVQQMVTTRAKGGPAVVGLADTLFALQEGRVLTLLVEEGFAAPGYLCPDCDYLSTNDAARCLFCGTSQRAQPVANVVERGVHRAILQGARVEVIADSPALARAGRIGALLRY